MSRQPLRMQIILGRPWRCLLFWLALLVAKTTIAQELQTTEIDGFTFRFPSSYRLEKVTTPTITSWPIVATWDDGGNLVVAEFAGGKQSVEDQLKTKPHRVVRLIDADRDGVFDTRQVVAENLAFPEGVLCLGKSILVSAPPQIWKLTDNDGDGVCEERSVWHDGNTLTFCANDLHGPFLGPEGWVYWCKSAFAEQELAIQSPFPSKSSASHLYRKPIDAPKADRILTGGMDNLVDVAFDPFGERFFVSTFLHHPGNGVRDGIGHAVYGAVFGKDHGVLLNHPRTGPLFQPLVELGPAAPSGLLRMSDAKSWVPTERLDSSVFVAALFNLQRVTAHEFVRSGAAFTATTRDLVECDQLDFHPVDVLEDVDGSLLIVDTGGWYDLCCPSSGNEERIAKGGIYRLSPIKSPGDKNSIASIWKEIDRASATNPMALIQHSSQRVRDIGATLLAARRDFDSISEAQQTDTLIAMVQERGQSIATRSTAFWTLAKRMEPEQSSTPSFVASLLREPSDPLCLAALQLSSTYRWSDRAQEMVGLLHSSDPFVQRLAAECVGRSGAAALLPKLHDALEVSAAGMVLPKDRALQHAMLYAMMELTIQKVSQEESVDYLSNVLANANRHSHSHVYSALWVLRELNLFRNRDLEAVWSLAQSDHSSIAPLASRALEGTPTLFGPWLERMILDSPPRELTAKQSQVIVTILASNAKDQRVQTRVTSEILALANTSTEIDPDCHSMRLVASAMKAYRGQSLPVEWSDALAQLWKAKPSLRDPLFASLSQVNIPKEAKSLIACLAPLIESTDISSATRVAAILPKGQIAIPVSVQKHWIQVASQGDATHKTYATRGLQRVDLDTEAWDLLLAQLPQLEPAEFIPMVETLASSRISQQSEFGNRLLENLVSIPTSKMLSPELLDRWFASHPKEIQVRVAITKSELFSPPADIKLSIDRIEESLPVGDAHRGQDVFRSSKAICSRCHRMGYVGGNIGPELTKIGATRNRRDLIEAIVYPSHRIAQGFSSTSILTTDDTIYSGLIVTENEKQIELVQNIDKRQTIEKEEIAKRTLSKISVMPEGIDKVLTAQELSDLISYLLQSK